MSCEPVDFLKTAKDLLTTNKRESDTRAVISRSYYAVYLRFREKGSAFAIAPAVLTASIGKTLKHEKLIRELRISSNLAVASIGDNFEWLYSARIRADYELHKHVPAKDAQQAYDNAVALNSEIDAFGLAQLGTYLESHLRQKYAAYLPPNS